MFDLYADLAAAVRQLETIAELLQRLVAAAERLSPPIAPQDATDVRQATVDDLHTIDDQANQEAAAMRAGQAARWGVVPDSQAFEQAMTAHQKEMERVHGKESVNWDEAFRQARRALGDH